MGCGYMAETPVRLPVIRFGPFEADLAARQLRKHGLRVKLQDQPFTILAIFLGRPGEVVSRDQLREQLWSESTFVDFDNGMNAAINKLREALGDSADNPRYVETLPRRGYRFIAPVGWESLTATARPSNENGAGKVPPEPAVPALAPVTSQALSPSTPDFLPPSSTPAQSPFRNRRALAAAMLFVFVLAGSYWGLKKFGPRASASSGKVTLAVLPFQNLSGDPAQEYFSEGLTEELIAQVSRLQPERLGVIARSTAMQYRKTPKGVDEIARELGLQYVLEGSVRRDGPRLRITAQLIETREQTHIWAATYEREARDVLSIQQDVAGQVARALANHVLPAGVHAVTKASTSSPEAFEAYIQGRFFWNKRSHEGVQKSIRLFEEAIRCDPNYALAYVGLADSYLIWGGRLSGVPPDEAYRRARAAVNKALALDDSLAEAHIAGSAIAFDHEWDFAKAQKGLQRALELDPSYAFGHQWNAEFLAAMGRHEEALQAIGRSLALDPFSRSGNLVRGQILMYMRRYDQALSQFKKLAEIDSTFIAAYTHQARVYRLQNKPAEWFAAYYRWLFLLGTSPQDLEKYTSAFRTGGLPAVTLMRIADLRKQADRTPGVPYAIARMYAALGEKENSLHWLEKAAQEHDDFATHITVDPEFDTLRSDPRFRQLLQRIGFPEPSRH